MTRARRRELIVAVLAIFGVIALGLAIVAARHSKAARSGSEPARPTLLLLTSLPLVFGEDFTIGGNGSRALTALQARYRVVSISVASHRELSKGRLLLMAQPFAQTADNLVTLDTWVRAGGHVVLLADPALDWPSKRPLGDRTRPPPMFADTGLLGHWGVRLDAPDQRGPAVRQLGGRSIATVSPGELSGACAVSSDHFVARCRVGRGMAIIVADADFLNVDTLGDPGAHNLDSLVQILASM